jgi:hypothetical protein
MEKFDLGPDMARPFCTAYSSATASRGYCTNCEAGFSVNDDGDCSMATFALVSLKFIPTRKWPRWLASSSAWSILL